MIRSRRGSALGEIQRSGLGGLQRGCTADRPALAGYVCRGEFATCVFGEEVGEHVCAECVRERFIDAGVGGCVQ